MTQRFDNIDTALPAMASEIMHEGVEVGSRLGERTMELLHEQIVLEKPWMREVLVKDRNANIVAQIAETMWVLAGRNDIEFLGQYLPRAKDFSDDGKTWRGGYGPRLRAWVDFSTDFDEEVDQIKHIVDLLSQDRLTRRAVVAIYDPSVDTLPGKDIPCNDFLSFISRNGRLDLSVFVRSNDLVWGWSGINAFEWSALQEIVAGILGLEVGHLVFNTTSLHIYDRHWPRADRFAKDPLVRGFNDSPRFQPGVRTLEHVDELIKSWFEMEALFHTDAVPSPSAVGAFLEPMMRSWLQVIAWYWTGNEEYLKPLEGTRLWAATQQVPKSVREHVWGQRAKATDGTGVSLVVGKPSGPDGQYREGDKVTVYSGGPFIDESGASAGFGFTVDPFVEYVDKLHREKSAAYGDSWKRRGEQMSILANIARKVDRLGNGTETADETQADTAVDLLVYLAKYRLWLSETNPDLSLPMMNAGNENDNVRALLEELPSRMRRPSDSGVLDRDLDSIRALFSALEEEVTANPHRNDDTKRATIMEALLVSSYVVARARWEALTPNA